MGFSQTSTGGKISPETHSATVSMAVQAKIGAEPDRCLFPACLARAASDRCQRQVTPRVATGRAGDRTPWRASRKTSPRRVGLQALPAPPDTMAHSTAAHHPIPERYQGPAAATAAARATPPPKGHSPVHPSPSEPLAHPSTRWRRPARPAPRTTKLPTKPPDDPYAVAPPRIHSDKSRRCPVALLGSLRRFLRLRTTPHGPIRIRPRRQPSPLVAMPSGCWVKPPSSL